MADLSSRRVIQVQNQAIISINANAKSSLLCRWSVPEPEPLWETPGRLVEEEVEEEEEDEDENSGEVGLKV